MIWNNGLKAWNKPGENMKKIIGISILTCIILFSFNSAFACEKCKGNCNCGSDCKCEKILEKQVKCACDEEKTKRCSCCEKKILKIFNRKCKCSK